MFDEYNPGQEWGEDIVGCETDTTKQDGSERPDGGSPTFGVHVAKAEHGRSLRRLACEILPDLLCLSLADLLLAIAGAEMLTRMRSGGTYSVDAETLTREAGRLFSRLPDDASDAQSVLQIVSKFVAYVESGLIDINGLAAEPGPARIAGVGSRGHLRVVESI